MGWVETRKKARTIVHSTFSIPAVYTDPDGTVTPCNVRRHNEMKEFGDLDREGFARVIEDVNQLVFDLEEVEPVKNATIFFADIDATFKITNFLPKTTDNYYRAEVTLVK